MNDSDGGQRDEGGLETFLEHLVREAPADHPDYACDLHRLSDLIKAGGPYNCTSSLLFGYLRDIYPSEYAALKERWVRAGGALVEGFEHASLPGPEQARRLNVQEDLVFCLDGEEYGQDGYQFFMHEADVLLLALASKVESGELDSLGARRVWLPYGRWFPPLYDSEEWEYYALEIELATWRPGMANPLESNPFDQLDFPPATAEYLPASDAFALYADGLGLSDVGFLGSWSGSTGEIFEVADEEALQNLTAAVAGEYRIVVRRDLGEYDFTGASEGPSAALSCLERTVLGFPHDARAQ